MNRSIEASAAQWAARVDRGALTEEDLRELEAWLSQDRRHLGAFARVRAVAAHFDRAPALGPSFDHTHFREPLRRRLLRGRGAWWAGALAAGIAVVAVGLIVRVPSGEFSTQRGEVRLVPLADGSAITLNTETKVDVDYTQAERKVELVTGEALFNVAHDRARPFIVHAGDTHIRAVGTSFTVRRLAGDKVKVLVREGVVEVTQDVPVKPTPIRVVAESQAVLQPLTATAIAPVPAPQIDRELAWQRGMISLDGRTLREAAEEFARYSSTRIIVNDPEIAERTVTGLFSANNPVGFARAVATSMNLKVDVDSSGVRLSR
jgi:transmembrane sensor